MIEKRAVRLYIVALLMLMSFAWQQGCFADEPKGKGTVWDAWSDYKPDQDPGMPDQGKGTESGKPPTEADKPIQSNDSKPKESTVSPKSSKKDASARGAKVQARIKAASKAPSKTSEPAEKK